MLRSGEQQQNSTCGVVGGNNNSSVNNGSGGEVTERKKNVFMREDFDPLMILMGGGDELIVPPISNIKPYKTLDAINLDQLLMKNKQKKQQKQPINKKENTKSGADQQTIPNHELSSLPSSTIGESSSSSDASIVKSNIPDMKDLPVLSHKDTYRGFLEHKYGQLTSNHSGIGHQHSFTLLYQSVMEKRRVGVLVRTRHGHSKLEGVLSGFDKFFNMILLDVKENYKELEIRFKKQKILDKVRGITSTSKNSRNRKRRVRCLVEKEREFPMLFVKGSLVISVMSSNTQ